MNIRETSFHEAAHACMLLVNNCSFDHVRIWQGIDADTWHGVVAFQHGLAINPAGPNGWTYLVTCVVGDLAAGRYATGRVPDVATLAGTDWELAQRLALQRAALMQRYASEDVHAIAWQLLDDALCDAKEWLSFRINWRYIEIVAGHLVRRKNLNAATVAALYGVAATDYSSDCQQGKRQGKRHSAAELLPR